MRRFALTLGCVCVLASGCMHAPLANPEGAPQDALALRYLLDQGCVSILLDRRPVEEAMHRVRLTKHTVYSLVGSPSVIWGGFYPGLAAVHADPGLCSMTMHGPNQAAYRQATSEVLRARLGADAREDAQSGYKAYFQGQITGCRQSIRYTYYEAKPSWFQVVLTRVPDCASDPLLRFSG